MLCVGFTRAADVLPAEQLGQEGGFSLWNANGYSSEGAVREQGFDISLYLSYLEELIAVVGLPPVPGCW